MMKFDDLESMAKLKLPENERVKIKSQLEALESEFSVLEKADTTATEPMASVLSIHSVLRDDKSEKLFARADILKNAPEQYDGYFQVPGTLE